MPSKAYDFFLHLREGHIIPFQNITYWEALYEDVFLTTGDTQNYPTSFLVHPTCNETFCFAEGQYINDDGETTNLTERRNAYKIRFIQDLSAPDTWELYADQTLNATAYQNSEVNYNDVMA